MALRFATPHVYNGTSTIRLSPEDQHFTFGGIGIKFPPTVQSAADANTLDEYEEGLWNPTFTVGGSTPAGLSYSMAQGSYTRIGRLVSLTFGMYASWSSGTGSLEIRNLPFAEGIGGGYREPGMAIANSTYSMALRAAVIASDTRLILYKGSSGAQLEAADTGTTFWIHGSLTYHTST